ncbi:MAG: ComEC/Rec2 family competence protein, partial [Desulfobacterales bacterium]|nr:ComEC/Rec2 family competence protein [Desulfobacterales bacterium]
DAFRTRISSIIEDSGQGSSVGVLKALIVGDRSAISRPLRDAFNRAGVGHLLAISGLHIGIVASVAFFFFKWLLAYINPLLWTASTRKSAALMSLLPVVLYGIVAGFSPSTQRAVIMVGIFLMTFLFEREHDLINTLALAALAILMIYPPSLFSISFQLSFMAVLSIIFGLNCLQRYRPDPDLTIQNGVGLKLKKRLMTFFFVSLFAIGGTLPLTMFYFNQISLVGILANFLVVPLVGFIVVPVGLLAAFVSTVSMTTALWCFKICHAVLRPSLTTIEILADIPIAAVKTFTPGVLELVSYYLLLWALLNWIAARRSEPNNPHHLRYPGSAAEDESCASPVVDRSGRLSEMIQKFTVRFANGVRGEGSAKVRQKLYGAIAVLVILVLLGDAGYWYYRRFGHRDLRITVIDVGSGSAALLELPGGHTMLIDGGGFSDNSVFDIGARVLAPLLWRKKIKTVDTLILTHPNSDHLNGLIYIAKHFNVQQIWTNGEARDTMGYRGLMDTIAVQNIHFPPYKDIPVRQMINGVGFSVFYPHVDFMEKKARDRWRNSNNNSLVIRISFGTISFLFPGDIMAAAEHELTQATESKLNSTVLMAPHHGSKTSSTDIFLGAVNPQICIISCGWKSRYKFPHPAVLQRYTRRGCRTYRTDLNGAVTLITDGQELEVRTFLTKKNSDLKFKVN